MANSNAVWGIDIGQCALKALKCRPHEKEPNRVVVESFDYIEYPKILSQPEADPEELVREALQQFLSRNELIGDRVAISVAGQSGLARFIKLPPVESKKIPDIVKYEARQQIPFSLDDVVWDYQQLTGGSEEDEFALEPEVGLFAMKRDQVARALKPLEDAGIEVDVIQLMPLAVYNYVCFDLLDDLRAQPYDSANPPESTVVISLGTDTTDLVVTNGYRVWQRNIPIGGSHFTRALSRELKLTFVKAEHLKRNATQADDPKAVFQAMRPVFSDLLAEIQRSLGFFTSIDKTAKIGKVIALGNGMKLPGLQRYLSQNLEQAVRPIDSFDRLASGSSSSNAKFKENVLSFAVAYGLCVQGLGKAEIRTNLLPEEIVRTRLIRSKKPWALAGAAALLAGLTVNYIFHVNAWSGTATQAMADAEQAAKSAVTMASGHQAKSDEIRSSFEQIEQVQANLVSNIEGRKSWLELIKAIDAVLPVDPRPADQRQATAEDIGNRPELHITSIDSQKFTDLGTEWFATIQANYQASRGITAAAATNGGLPPDGDAAASAGPTGPGWVVQLTGYHYHNQDTKNEAARYVNNTLIKNLEEGFVELPDGNAGQPKKIALKDFGISHPWVVAESRITEELVDPEAMSQTGPGNRGGNRRYGGNDFDGGGTPVTDAKLLKLRRFDFVVQFCWQPTTIKQRAENAALRVEQERAAAEAAATETALN